MTFHHRWLIAAFSACVVAQFASAAPPVKVFILAGPSNMEGQAVADHDQVLSFDDLRVIRAFDRNREGGRGERTLRYDGRRVKHYALTDHEEFFAEMTEAYFGANDFFPFTQAEMKETEPEIFAVLREIWETPADE